MNWLTREQVQAAAKAGDAEALECSIEHWRQLATATQKEVLEANANGLAFGMRNCALCTRHGCSNCPLYRQYGACAGDRNPYLAALNAFCAMCRKPDSRITSFRLAAKAMLAALEGLREVKP